MFLKKVKIDALLGVAFFAIGGILMSYGAWLCFRPAGYLVGGFLCVAIAAQHIMSSEGGQ